MICFLFMGITLINFFFIKSQNTLFFYNDFELRLIKIRNKILRDHNNIDDIALIPLSCGSNNEFSDEVDEHNPIIGCLWDNEIDNPPELCSKENIDKIYALYDYDLKIYFKNSECTVSYSIDGPQRYHGFHSKVIHIKNMIISNHNNDNQYEYVQLGCGINNEFSLEVNEDYSITACLWDEEIQNLPASCSKDYMQNIYALYDNVFSDLIIYFESSECTVSFSIDTTDDDLYESITYQGFHYKVIHIKNMIISNHNNDNQYEYVQLGCGINNEFSLEVNEDNSITGCLWDEEIQKFPTSCSKENIDKIYALYNSYIDELIIYFANSECTVSFSIDTTNDDLYGPVIHLCDSGYVMNAEKNACQKQTTSGDVAVKVSILNIMIFLIGFVTYLE